MRLYELLEGIETISRPGDREVAGVTSDTRQIIPGSVFVCLRGSVTDGHSFAQKAIDSKAAAVVCDHDMGLEGQVVCEDTHLAYALMCANLFGNPQREMKLIGVTGTNGKTTVTHIIKDVIEGCGKKAGMIGTIENQIGDMSIPAKYTTPDPLTFYTTLARMRDAGCEYVVMEVSSHGLDQKRVGGCRFEAGVFTNLTQDHLDYHKTMENYYQAKRRLFLMSDVGIINIDDDYGERLTKDVTCKTLTYSVAKDAADYTAKSVSQYANGSSFAFVGKGLIARVKLPVPGEFSVANAMAAIVTCLALGFKLDEVIKNVEISKGVPGRFEVLDTNADYTVIRDYAHTPDALEKILRAVRATTKGRIVTLFGCAGNRDRTKRPAMTDAVAAFADFVILTSDNPRGEDPQQIIEDAMPGFLGHKTPYKVIVDRYEAIKWALENARPGDILLLAGKGHEDYQVLAHGTIHFDEREIVAELLSKMDEKTEE